MKDVALIYLYLDHEMIIEQLVCKQEDLLPSAFRKFWEPLFSTTLTYTTLTLSWPTSPKVWS